MDIQNLCSLRVTAPIAATCWHKFVWECTLWGAVSWCGVHSACRAGDPSKKQMCRVVGMVPYGPGLPKWGAVSWCGVHSAYRAWDAYWKQMCRVVEVVPYGPGMPKQARWCIEGQGCWSMSMYCAAGVAPMQC